MTDTWITKFKGRIEERPVEVQVYSDGEALRVITEQPETETPSGSFSEGQYEFPLVINKGDCIHLEGENESELLNELVSFGFSNEAAEEIVTHTRS